MFGAQPEIQLEAIQKFTNSLYFPLDKPQVQSFHTVENIQELGGIPPLPLCPLGPLDPPLGPKGLR